MEVEGCTTPSMCLLAGGELPNIPCSPAVSRRFAFFVSSRMLGGAPTYSGHQLGLSNINLAVVAFHMQASYGAQPCRRCRQLRPLHGTSRNASRCT